MSQPDKDQPNKETEPQRKLNPYDTNSVKACLDQSVIQFFDDKQFPEDHTLTTRKTILGGFGCLLALIAHFYPIPFPNNIPLLAVCVVLYPNNPKTILLSPIHFLNFPSSNFF
eukprot:TRINITY_DN913_c0_g1_i2.p1 TRINITY_DN913_c0_g1~~TRINITY_DN913_c0_g1_i2.p1  ORF type:complete len:127 (-),score=22.37 TRINITY_DN913_c0_g1_i2:480-818(-)